MQTNTVRIEKALLIGEWYSIILYIIITDAQYASELAINHWLDLKVYTLNFQANPVIPERQLCSTFLYLVN